MNKKKASIIAVIAIALCAIAVFCFVGITVYINGVICLTTKYYSTGSEAFFKDYSPTAAEITTGNVIGSLEEIATVAVDENNAFCIAKTDLNSLAVITLKTKGEGKYFYYGDLTQLPVDSDFTKAEMYTSNRIVNGIFFSGTVNWCLINSDVLDRTCFLVVEAVKINDDFYFCWYLSN